MYPAEYLYSKDHEWIRVDGGIGVVGITDFAQKELGDVVFVELPAPGRKLAKHDVLGSVESVKAVSDIYCPVGGEVIEANAAVSESPEKLNQSPHGDAWLIKIRLSNPADLDGLMKAAEYEAFIANAKH